MKVLDEVNARIFDRRVDWTSIDVAAARRAPELLDLLREACLVESWFPVYMTGLIGLVFDDPEATAIFTIEAFEAYGHYYLLRRYLEHVGHDAPTDDEIAALRRSRDDTPPTDIVRELVNFMGTEMFAADFFETIARRSEEPILGRMLVGFAGEERVHSDFAKELLERMAANDPAVAQRAERAAASFTHVGRYVLPTLSSVKGDNLGIILEFSRAVAEVTGRPLSDAALGELEPEERTGAG
jgi:hypothetical protein